MGNDGAPPKPQEGTDWVDVAATAVEGIPVVGKALAKLIRSRAWRPILVVALAAWLLLVYPLLVPALAGWWINLGLLASWHQPYADNVRRAFRVEELADHVALRGNRRLDYYQAIEMERSANGPLTLSFSVQRHQRVVFRKEDVTLRSVDEQKCPVPLRLAKRGTRIFDVKVGGTTVGGLLYGPDVDTIEFNSDKWSRLKEESIDGRLVIRLDPVADLQATPCAELVAPLRVSIEVFKDLVGAPAAKASAAST